MPVLATPTQPSPSPLTRPAAKATRILSPGNTSKQPLPACSPAVSGPVFRFGEGVMPVEPKERSGSQLAI
jgi:hypothetical protein